MIGLMLLGAIFVSALLQAVVRHGSSGSAEAPGSLRLSAGVLLLVGTVLSIAPLFPLASDLLSVRSPAEFLLLTGFLLVSLAIILPAWIWVALVRRRSVSRSASGFVVAVSLVNTAIAIRLYRGLLSGDADSQDGIVVQIVPMLQFAVTAASAMIRRAMEQKWDVAPAKTTGHGAPVGRQLP